MHFQQRSGFKKLKNLGKSKENERKLNELEERYKTILDVKTEFMNYLKKSMAVSIETSYKFL